MVIAGGNADGKCSEQMEGEDFLRKVECLRGRLLAERAASRNAKVEADQMGTKLIELDSRLKEETKLRNRAEKRLKFLMKKLEALEIFYVSDESEKLGFVDKSEISSASSVASISTKEIEYKEVNSTSNSSIQNIQESMENSPKSSVVSVGDLKQTFSPISAYSSQTHDSPADEEINSYPQVTGQKLEIEELKDNILSPEKCHACPAYLENLSSSVEALSGKSSEIGSIPDDSNLNKDNHSFKCSVKEEILNGDPDEEQDDNVDNSMAIVPVDLPKTKQTIDPVVLDATVKEVLDALRHAKEKLQTSMERRRMIKVG